MKRLNKSLVKILCKLISDYRRDWADFLPKAVLAYNTSVHESTGFTPYLLMFRREAILPLDATLRLETAPSQGSAQTYPDYVFRKKAVGGDKGTSEGEPQGSAEIPESL